MQQITSQGRACCCAKLFSTHGSGKGQKVKILVCILQLPSESCLLEPFLRPGPDSFLSHSEAKGCSWVVLTTFWQQHLGGKKAGRLTG